MAPGCRRLNGRGWGGGLRWLMVFLASVGVGLFTLDAFCALLSGRPRGGLALSWEADGRLSQGFLLEPRGQRKARFFSWSARDGGPIWPRGPDWRGRQAGREGGAMWPLADEAPSQVRRCLF